MNDLVNIRFGVSAAVGLMGYIVVFFGLILLMLVVMLLAAIMRRNAAAKREAAQPETPAAQAPPAERSAPTGSEPELFDTDPRDAAMVMAVLAYQLGKPLEELRFKSIREIR